MEEKILQIAVVLVAAKDQKLWCWKPSNYPGTQANISNVSDLF